MPGLGVTPTIVDRPTDNADRDPGTGLDSGAAEPWAYAIVGAVHLAGDWWLERKTMSREQLVAYLTTLVWDGMFRYQAPAAAVGMSEELMTNGRTR